MSWSTVGLEHLSSCMNLKGGISPGCDQSAHTIHDGVSGMFNPQDCFLIEQPNPCCSRPVCVMLPQKCSGPSITAGGTFQTLYIILDRHTGSSGLVQQTCTLQPRRMCVDNLASGLFVWLYPACFISFHAFIYLFIRIKTMPIHQHVSC